LPTDQVSVHPEYFTLDDLSPDMVGAGRTATAPEGLKR